MFKFIVEKEEKSDCYQCLIRENKWTFENFLEIPQSITILMLNIYDKYESECLTNGWNLLSILMNQSMKVKKK